MYNFYADETCKPIFNSCEIDIRKIVAEALSINGIISVHPLLFSTIYVLFNENCDIPFSIYCNFGGIGSIQIIITDLIPENEYRIMTESDFNKYYGK